jgi:hypothetical protein
MDAPKTKLVQHEITEELEKRSGLKGLKLIRLKGYTPRWDLGGTRENPLDQATAADLQGASTICRAKWT